MLATALEVSSPRSGFSRWGWRRNREVSLPHFNNWDYGSRREGDFAPPPASSRARDRRARAVGVDPDSHPPPSVVVARGTGNRHAPDLSEHRGNRSRGWPCRRSRADLSYQRLALPGALHGHRRQRSVARAPAISRCRWRAANGSTFSMTTMCCLLITSKYSSVGAAQPVQSCLQLCLGGCDDFAWFEPLRYQEALPIARCYREYFSHFALWHYMTSCRFRPSCSIRRCLRRSVDLPRTWISSRTGTCGQGLPPL